MTKEQPINIPQLILVILFGGLLIRWIFFSSSSNRSNNATSSAANIRAREADVERIQQMFPQVSRRSVMWDLQRNGGNIVATTERILSGRGLETPPQTFQPPLPPALPSSSATQTSGTASNNKPTQPDLISRYNLTSKLASTDIKAEYGSSVGSGKSMSGGKQAWSQNKSERQALLQRRREEMILSARRRMEAKVAAEEATAADISTHR